MSHSGGEPELRVAAPGELDAACELFWGVADAMEGTPDDAMWRRGVHPLREDLSALIDGGALHLVRVGDELAGAVAVDAGPCEEMAGASWPSGVPGSDALVARLLCVHPAHRGRGVGRFAMEAVIEMARARGARAVRLSVIRTNLAAKRLYERMGFAFADTSELVYDETGRLCFDLMELVLA